MDWDPISAIAGIIAALAAIFAIPAVYRLLSTLRRSTKEYCERFDWDDIQTGEQMHECFFTSCPHVGGRHGPDSRRCWEHQLSTVFSRSWIRSARIGRRKVSKPKGLPSGRIYIRTDAQTIRAFILCGEGCSSKDREFEASAMPWTSEGLQTGAIRIRFRVVGEETEKIITAHLEGGVRTNLTKGDVDGVTNGYPPWYRETMTLSGLSRGKQVPSPINTYSDVARAGWIVGIGMSETLPLEAAPRSRWFAEKPVRRLHDILKEKILPAFPNGNVRAAIDAVGRMLATLSESGVFIRLFDTNGKFVDWRDERKKFSQADATFAMMIFNSPPSVPLTDGEITQMKPILLSILSAAYFGSAEVTKAFKNMWNGFDDLLLTDEIRRAMGVIYPGQYCWPVHLRDPKQAIYLEDCVGYDP